MRGEMHEDESKSRRCRLAACADDEAGFAVQQSAARIIFGGIVDEMRYEIRIGIFDLLSCVSNGKELEPFSRLTAIRARIWLTDQSVHSFIGPAKEVTTPSVFISQGMCCSKPKAAKLPVMVFRILSATSLCSPLTKPKGLPKARSAITS